MKDKPYAPACERNRDPILAVLRQHFADRRQVLEIGSGTGQHAVYFAGALLHLHWQTSDRAENLPGIRLWLDEARLPNLPPPLELGVAQARWPAQRYDAVFSANTLHIMSWTEVETLFARLPEIVEADAKLAIYGPFNYGGQYTSDSNAAFDASLKAAVPHRGIRDFEAVDALARKAGFELLEDRAMPANNRCLVFGRGSASADPEQVLQFWFGDLADEAAAARRQESLWWGGGAEADALVRRRFGGLRESAIAGALADWERSARGRLALILLVDQFSRNICRGRAEAYAHDGLAQQWCLDGLDRGDNRSLSPLQRMFFYLPLEHAESRELQARSLELMQALVEEVPPQQRELFDNFAGYARHHRGVVERFGRFPHRNAILGRSSTPQELEFLRRPSNSP